MDEGRVDHAIGRTGARGEAVGVRQLAPMGFDAQLRQRRCRGIAAGQAKNLVACAEQLLHDRLADEARGSGDKNFHDDSWFDKALIETR